MMADHIGPLSHLHAKDTSFVLVPRAPLATLLAFRDRMGWTAAWVSSRSTTFNEDFGTTMDGEERHAISVFLRDGDRVFHTWSTYNRGEEPFMLVWDLLDLTPYGRQETCGGLRRRAGRSSRHTNGCGCTTRTDAHTAWWVSSRRALHDFFIASPGPPFLSFPGPFGPSESSTSSDVVGGGGGEVVVAVVGTGVLVVTGCGVGGGESAKIRMPARKQGEHRGHAHQRLPPVWPVRRGDRIGTKVAAGGGGEVSTIVGGRTAGQADRRPMAGSRCRTTPPASAARSGIGAARHASSHVDDGHQGRIGIRSHCRDGWWLFRRIARARAAICRV